MKRTPRYHFILMSTYFMKRNLQMNNWAEPLIPSIWNPWEIKSTPCTYEFEYQGIVSQHGKITEITVTDFITEAVDYVA